MKKTFLSLILIFLSFLISGCSSDYDTYIREYRSYREVLAIIKNVDQQLNFDNDLSKKILELNQSDEFLPNDNHYINVDGKKIKSPVHSNTVPPGATAVCNDGTYSFSQNRRGTCSGHKGVLRWLY